MDAKQQKKVGCNLVSLDGNQAATDIAYKFSDVCFIYPITPASNMGQYADEWSSAKVKNVFDNVAKVFCMQSEGGAAAACHGAAASGSLVSTFTCSQGLLLMIPQMYKLVGEMLPVVFHVASRSVATISMDIFCDHSDVNSCRNTGVPIMSSHSVQEAHDLALVSHLAALRCRVPFLHFFDGMRTSHEMQKALGWTREECQAIMNKHFLKDIHNMRENIAMRNDKPTARGGVVNHDLYWQVAELSFQQYDDVPQAVEDVMKMIHTLCGRKYDLFSYVGAPDAEIVFVIMGSAAATVSEVIRHMEATQSAKVGVVKVHLYSPFSIKHFLAAVPKTAKTVVVLNRCKEGNSDGILTLDVRNAFYNGQMNEKVGWFKRKTPIPHIIGGFYGIGGKEFAPIHFLGVWSAAKEGKLMNRFNVGLIDDINHMYVELPAANTVPDTVPTGTKQCMFFGLGSDGTVTANKEACKIIGSNTKMLTQAYFAYDSKKSGGLTVSHLRFGTQVVDGAYEIQWADYTGVHNKAYLNKYDLVERAKNGSVLMINAPYKTAAEIQPFLPGSLRKAIAEKNIKLYTVDATRVAKQVGLGSRINMVCQAAFFKLSEVIPFDDAIEYMKKSIQEKFGGKGQDVVDKNIKALVQAGDSVTEIKYDNKEWLSAEATEIALAPEAAAYAPYAKLAVPSARLKGNAIPVSELQDVKGGSFQTNSTRFEKRGVATQVPVWKDIDKCTQCNVCSFVCPHGTIRPMVFEEDEKLPETMKTIPLIGGPRRKNMQFRVQVSPMDCMGCGACAMECSENILDMVDVEDINAMADTQNWEIGLQKRKDPHSLTTLDPTTVRGSQFADPMIEFHGACAGCGEVPYFKLLTQLFGERLWVINSCGCSLVWSASHPLSPYTFNQDGMGPTYHGTLFENTAEVGYGTAIAIDTRREDLIKNVNAMITNEQKEEISDELKNHLKNWVRDVNQGSKSYNHALRIRELLPKAPPVDSLMNYLRVNQDVLVKKSCWVVGGDGWAYDIGFGGLDHVIASGQNLNILVFDTEVYSNTGGQASKATARSAVAHFASGGKVTAKKELGIQAILYGSVYVASVALGASRQQLMKAVADGEAYDGPSLILSYCPCIAHGIKTVLMGASINTEKLAVQSGYWPLYRYDPSLAKLGQNPLSLDYVGPRIELEVFLQRETRFVRLRQSNPEHAKSLCVLLNRDIERRDRLMKSIHRLAEKDVAPEPAMPRSGSSVFQGNKPRILILYGSDTGNAESVARGLGAQCYKKGFSVEVSEGNVYDSIDQLCIETFVVIVASTCGQGETPDNAKSIQSELQAVVAKVQANKTPSNLLQKTNYCVFGLGDTSYPFFCEAAKLLDNSMDALGAKRVIPTLYGNDRDAYGYETQLEPWLESFWEYCLANIKLKPLAESEIKPAYHVEIQDESKSTADVEIELPSACPPAEKPSIELPLYENSKLCVSERADRDVRNLVLDISKHKDAFDYECGDVLCIEPRNTKERIMKFLTFYGYNPHTVIRIRASSSVKTPNFNNYPITVFQLCERYLDLFGRPNKAFFVDAARFCDDEDKKAKLLHMMSNDLDGQYELALYLSECPTYADVLMDFCSRPPLPFLLELVPIMKSRQYTVASSSVVHPDEIELTVAIDQWVTPTKVDKIGVNTLYLSQVEASYEKPAFLYCSLKEGDILRLAKPDVPILMAGLGCGLAPFIAFAQEREHYKKQGVKIASTAQFFGCRWRAVDYIHGDKMEKWKDEGVISHLGVAFSRDQAQKIYIQDKIREVPELVNDILVTNNGLFYYCGQAGRSVTDLEKAITYAIKTAQNISDDKALEIVAGLKKNNQFRIEAWGGVPPVPAPKKEDYQKK